MPQITKATTPLEFIPPSLTLWVLRLATKLLPNWLKNQLQISQINAVHIDRLVEVYKQSQMGRLRLILAFRHPSMDDPFCMAHLLTKILPEAARYHRISLKSPVFVHFLYDRDISRWAGKYFNWLSPKLGGISICRGKTEEVALQSARDLLVNGQMPLALAPEGASNGHNERLESLEFDAAQIAFLGMEDLVMAGRTEDILIVPIGIQYYYIDEPWLSVEQLLHQLEQDCGLEVDRTDSIVAINQSDGRPMRKLIYDRFHRLSQYLLYQMEDFYTRSYSYEMLKREPLTKSLSRTEIAQRVQRLLDFALANAESYFNIQPIGTKLDRSRQIQQVGRDWIYREDLIPSNNLPTIGQKLADRIATEADLRMWHTQIVASLVPVTTAYVKDKPTIDRFAEIALLLWDLVARIKGENPLNRPILGKRRVQMTIANPIPISDYWERYQSSDSAAEQAINDLTQELQTTLEGTIDRDK